MAVRTDRPEMYEVARRWRDVALLDDDSLFTPGQEIWSTRWLEEIRQRFVVKADEGGDPFSTKLRRQLKDAEPATYQLMGELMYVHFLAADSVTSRTKRKRIEEVLGWSPEPASIPARLEVALEQGVGNAGPGFNRFRYRLLGFLIEFTLIWKTLHDADNGRIITDPWAMRSFIRERVPGRSDGLMRNALLHLFYPETFETIMTRNHKQKITKAFKHQVTNPSDDLDRMLLQIRESLSEEYGENFSFYEEHLKEQWDGSNNKRKVADTLTAVPEEPLPAETAEKGERAPLTLSRLAWELHLTDASHLERIVNLLEHRRQMIFYGPPGTGKTYVARKLAPHPRIAGDEDRVDLVQFHPSYAYEDFVEGYRPVTLDDGTAGFELREGPLKRIAREARQSPGERFVLIIDEINRGNLGKVLGELYFLLEYRNQQIKLQYSDEKFSLPDNLLIIGTMNTADRSIARIDSALRRRFHFVPFFPDEPPIKGLLERWLARHKPEMAWVAEVLDRANERLDRPHAAIGPSHFMHSYLDEEWVGMIWEHSVLPYIAEQYFGEEDRLEEFSLDRLRSEATSAEEQDEHADSDGD